MIQRLCARSVLCMVLAWPVHVVYATDDAPTALRCGRIVDVIAGRTFGPATIVVRAGRIAAIGQETPQDARVVDLASYTCLPGLIDLHTHIVNIPGRSAGNDLDRSSAMRALDGLHTAQRMLQTGFTTILDLGANDRYYATIAVRDAIAKAMAKGIATGPTMFVAPHRIGTTGGHSDINTLADDLHIEIPRRLADGADELRRAVREEVKHGADWIKLAVTGGVTSVGDSPLHSAYTDEELRAAVDEAHRLGRKVAVHAIGGEGITASVDAGVDCIEHGMLIDDETIRKMKQRNICLVPTLYVLNFVIERGAQTGQSAESVAKAVALRDARDRNMRKAFAAGIKIGFGSDTIFPPEEAPREFAELVRLGLSPADALRAATVNAAEILGITQQAGTIETGKAADIVAVDADPLEDVRTLENVRFVMKGGRIVKPLPPGAP